MKAILIARVSDVEQRKALPAQRLKLVEYAESKHYTYEYHEFDESAHTDDRKKFAALVEGIAQELTKVIVVFDKVDRFTRDASQSEVNTMGRLVSSDHIEIHFPSDNLYITCSSPAADQFRLGIGMLLAKYYSDTIRDNVKRRFDQMLHDGKWTGAGPLGYLNINNGTKEHPDKDIIVDETRREHILKIFRLRAEGMPYGYIAKAVNADGLTGRKGKPMTKATIEKIINNPFYYGEMRYKGMLYKHSYEPIITRAIYNRCKDVRERRAGSRTAYDSLDFTLKDLIRCGYCGSAITPYRSKEYVYLKCAGSKNGCANRNTPVSKIMPTIYDALRSLAFPADVVTQLIESLRARHDDERQYYSKNISMAQRELTKVRDYKKRLLYQRLDGSFTKDEYNDIVQDLRNKEDALLKRIDALSSDNKSFIVTASYLIDLAERAVELFEGASVALQQKMLRFLISNSTLMDQNLDIQLNDPYKMYSVQTKNALGASNGQLWCTKLLKVYTL